MVECHASDLIVRVRFPLAAPKRVFVEPFESLDKTNLQDYKNLMKHKNLNQL